MNVTPATERLVKNKKMTPRHVENAVRDYEMPGISTKTSKSTIGGKGKKKTSNDAGAPTKATRPLNSWIAFRSYYSNIFVKTQQKDISGLLTYLWQSDPFKAKWSVLAKAYSVIRDHQGKGNAPLDHFIAIGGPLMGIVEPAQYLEALGWLITTDIEGETTMQRVEIQVDHHLFDINVSVNDLLRYCSIQGYLIGDLSDVLLSNDEVVLTMGASSQGGEMDKPEVQDDTTSYEIVDEVISEAQDFGEEGADEPDMQDDLTGHLVAEAVSDEAQDIEKEGADELTVDSSRTSHAGAEITDEKSEATEHQEIADVGNTEDEEMANLNNDEVAADSAHTASEALSAPTVTSSIFNTEATNGNTASPDDTTTMDMLKVPQPAIPSQSAERLSPADFREFQIDSEQEFNAAFDPLVESFVFDPFSGNQFDAFDMSGGWDEFIDFNALA